MNEAASGFSGSRHAQKGLPMEARDKNGLTEREFLEAYGKKESPRPYVTADTVVFSARRGAVLLVKRSGHPFMGCWALPGGFIRADESAEAGALRELREETGIVAAEAEPIGLFSSPGRDPRGWVISQAYLCMSDAEPTAGDDAADVRWFRILLDSEKRPYLSCGDIRLYIGGDGQRPAFDHGEMIAQAIKKIMKKREEWIYV